MRTKPEGFILPDFGDSPAAPDPADTAGPAGPRKLALICSKGNLDMAYPGLILGHAAAGEGVETHIFFTFWGLDIINRKTNANLKFTMLGNTAVHMPELGNLRPGLAHLSLPQPMGSLPGMTGFSTHFIKKQLAGLGIPEIPRFLDLLAAAGVHMYACRLTLDMMKIIEADLHPAVEGVVGVADFIEISRGAQTIFI